MRENGREATAGRSFSYYTYGAAAALMHSLASEHPSIVSLSTTQATFGLPPVGTCRDEHGSEGPCLNHVLEITNRTGGAAARRYRPQIYISGALHGDEQVGIVTALELCRWLVERYETDEWVRRLVDSRTILVTPMTNAIGAASHTREEAGIDPNRDFPFDQSPKSCMMSVAARTVNEIYRAHMLQLVITFHGGMQAIAYTWGAYPYYRSQSSHAPDDNAMRDVSKVMSRFAGSGNVQNNKPYPYATMNELVYPVRGGMEDWGYAASWDTSFVSPCTPSTHGGYSAEKTKYDDAAIRAVTILVETSDQKTPPESTLGGEGGVYAPGGVGDGHIPRNMRLALSAIDLLEPYVAISAAIAPPSSRCVPVQWQVWGAVAVDDTLALWRPSPAHPWEEVLFAPPAHRAMHRALLDKGGAAGGGGVLVDGKMLGGVGVWGGDSPFSPATLSGCVKTPQQHTGFGQVAVSARVDTAWSESPTGAFAPKKGPQTHLARSRTDGAYRSRYGGFEVVGRARWLSEPLPVNCSTTVGCCARGNTLCPLGADLRK